MGSRGSECISMFSFYEAELVAWTESWTIRLTRRLALVR